MKWMVCIHLHFADIKALQSFLKDLRYVRSLHDCQGLKII